MLTITLTVFVFTFSSFISNRNHLLFSLLALEAIILSLIPPITLISNSSTSILVLIIILVFSVVEASVGLGALVNLSRITNNSLIRS